MRLRTLLISCLIFVSGCSAKPDPVAQRLTAVMQAALKNGPGSIAALDTVAPGQWDMVYVFEPYTSHEALAACLHIKSAKHLSQGIELSDHFTLIVLKDSTGHFRSFTVPRMNPDFGRDAVGRGYDRTTAQFVTSDLDGRIAGKFLHPRSVASIDCPDTHR